MKSTDYVGVPQSRSNELGVLRFCYETQQKPLISPMKAVSSGALECAPVFARIRAKVGNRIGNRIGNGISNGFILGQTRGGAK